MNRSPQRNVSPLAAWALAFGCALGWDAAVLPWSKFLPGAGPLGTVLGVLAGGLVMSVIAWNYRFMMSRKPGPGGAYAYVTDVLGADRGFLCGWFLCFAYISIIWLDATILAYGIQHSVNFNVHFGFHYVVAGNEVCMFHIAVSALVSAAAAAVCCRRRLALRVQTALAFLLAVCVVVCFAGAAFRHEGGLRNLGPAFAPGKGLVFGQILGIAATAPWLFIGFESISHVSGSFAFPVRKSFGVMLSAIAAVVAAYVLLTMIPVLVPALSTGFADWPRAVASLPPGAENNIAFSTIGRCFGPPGRVIVAVTLFSAVFTNLVGNTIAASRLLAAMADDESLPPWFGRRNAEGSPRNAVFAIAGLALFVFLLGETVIGVVVDIAMLGAALAYAYTSSATFAAARRESDRVACATGFAGVVVSALLILLFVLPVFSSHFVTMAAESLLVIACWCIAGLLTFLHVFRRDRNRRFGKSPVVWIVFFATIVFVSVLWVRQAAFETARKAFDGLEDLHDAKCGRFDDAGHDAWTDALRDSVGERRLALSSDIVRNSYVQASLTVAALVLMLSILWIIRRREQEDEQEKMRARNFFFSTVSHDIRTPLNAIIGFSEMLKMGGQTEEERGQAVDSILVSGKTLLGLINDVLDLSKLESGKMEISPEPTDCAAIARTVVDALRVSGRKNGVELRCRAGEMPLLVLDPQRLRQIVFNLAGNAVKFTERGFVEVRASFAPDGGGDGTGLLRLDVEDTGCGISEENLKTIGSAYVQVGDRKARIRGTGLGLAICRQLASAMGGRLEVKSTLGAGSVFSLVVPGVKSAGPAPVPNAAAAAPGAAAARAASGRGIRRILLVDDTPLNMMVLVAMLKNVGDFDIVTAADGAEAMEKLEAPGGETFDLVLTDLWMPNMNGEDLVRAIRAAPALAGIRVVVVTADVTVQDKFAASGFDGVLLKPITLANLGKILSGGAGSAKEGKTE